MSMTDDEVLEAVRLEHRNARQNNFNALSDLEDAKRAYIRAERVAKRAAEELHVARGILTRVEWARRTKGQK